jgi:hypothetical protein
MIFFYFNTLKIAERAFGHLNITVANLYPAGLLENNLAKMYTSKPNTKYDIAKTEAKNLFNGKFF